MEEKKHLVQLVMPNNFCHLNDETGMNFMDYLKKISGDQVPHITVGNYDLISFKVDSGNRERLIGDLKSIVRGIGNYSELTRVIWDPQSWENIQVKNPMGINPIITGVVALAINIIENFGRECYPEAFNDIRALERQVKYADRYLPPIYLNQVVVEIKAARMLFQTIPIAQFSQLWALAQLYVPKGEEVHKELGGAVLQAAQVYGDYVLVLDRLEQTMKLDVLEPDNNGYDMVGFEEPITLTNRPKVKIGFANITLLVL